MFSQHSISPFRPCFTNRDLFGGLSGASRPAGWWAPKKAAAQPFQIVQASIILGGNSSQCQLSGSLRKFRNPTTSNDTMRAHAKYVGSMTWLMLLLFASSAIAQRKLETKKAEAKPESAKTLGVDDAKVWKSLRSTTLSNDGKWFAYVVRPGEGDSQLLLYDIEKSEPKTFPIGASSGGGIAFSHDSKWFAYLISPTQKETKQAQQAKKPVIKRAVVMNLTNGEKTEIERAESLAFAGERGEWLAIRVARATGATAGKDAGAGSDLLLCELDSGKQLNLGNVSEYRFNKAGTWLAMVIDAAGQVGNGVQLRDMSSGAIVPLENDKAKYSKLSWTKEGDALAVLKAVEDKEFEQPLHSVIGWKKFDEGELQKHAYDPQEDDRFPKNMTISPNRTPTWTENRQAIVFGIHDAKPKKKSDEASEKKDDKSGDQQSSKTKEDSAQAEKKADVDATEAADKSPSKPKKDASDGNNRRDDKPSAKADEASKRKAKRTERRKRKAAAKRRAAGKQESKDQSADDDAIKKTKKEKSASKEAKRKSSKKSKDTKAQTDSKKGDAGSKKRKGKAGRKTKKAAKTDQKGDQPAAKTGGEAKPDSGTSKTDDAKDAPAEGGEKKAAAKAADKEQKPAGLVIWHWKDKRLQSQQQKEESRDKRFNFLAVYNFDTEKFVRLADDDLRTVSVNEKHRWAVGTDDSKYQLEGSLNGRRYRDVHVLELATGQKWLAVKKCRWYFGASPDGDRMLYFDDGHFHVYDIPSRTSVNVTKDAPVSFVDDEADYIEDQPPVRPLGWSHDGAFVILSDNWDLWAIPSIGGQATNLTKTGKRDGIRFQRQYRLDPEEKGLDLSKEAYVSAYGEWTKKAGIGRLRPGADKVEMLLWDDASFGRLSKAKEADVFMYTRETNEEAPNVYLAGADLKGKKVSDANPQQKDYAWSAGSRLVDYVGVDGKKLQAALYLPADYQAGKSYPTIVYIYEKLSSRLHRYSAPRTGGFSRSIYNSKGYAVLTPDIEYRLDDPGNSAVACVLPALEAAVKTGIVDPERVGLHGHSWGGYQTAFLITQTDKFKAAVAGAPLTNLISMYSSIYWNSGSANQPIFEASQGRFTAGYWEKLDAYTENSPVYFAKRVKTPLLLLHNDEDGAVDWNQGIEYFNALRRLKKPVVMLQYKGENHGLAKAENRRDYSLRMAEFFDHHLKGEPAPDWLKQGIKHLDHAEHLKQHAAQALK
jgi:dipeptidyl aminopeptidase/acylaminoacyl peptidase